jgi:hypothetical protein
VRDAPGDHGEEQKQSATSGPARLFRAHPRSALRHHYTSKRSQLLLSRAPDHTDLRHFGMSMYTREIAKRAVPAGWASHIPLRILNLVPGGKGIRGRKLAPSHRPGRHGSSRRKRCASGREADQRSRGHHGARVSVATNAGCQCHVRGLLLPSLAAACLGDLALRSFCLLHLACSVTSA